MDTLTQSLHSYLVRMGYEGVDHESEHMMEHLLHLLNPADEEALVNYYGLFGQQRMALAEIAGSRDEEPATTMATIDKCVRRLAVTPEWQMLTNNNQR